MQMEIAQGTVHVWVTFSSDIVEERLLEGYLELLSVEERERRQRFHYERDRHRYLVTRALVRDVLSRYVPVRPQDWVFAANAYGRPNIVNEAGRAAGLRFNVS